MNTAKRENEAPVKDKWLERLADDFRHPAKVVVAVISLIGFVCFVFAFVTRLIVLPWGMP